MAVDNWTLTETMLRKSSNFIFIIVFCAGFLKGTALSQDTDTQILRLSVFIEPTIALNVSAEGESVVFSQADIEKGQAAKSLQISLNSNLGAPYKVFISPSGPLTNARGRALPAEYAKFSITATKKGKSSVPAPIPIPLEETLIYSSNSRGESDTFTLTLYFEPKSRIVPAGRYISSFIYRIVTE